MLSMSDGERDKNRIGVLRAGGEFRLVALTPIAATTRLYCIEGEVTAIPTRYSVQIGPDTHIDLSPDYDLYEILDRYYWRFMNHHCEPNTRIRDRDVIALRDIDVWEEITFNYNTTEYAMAEPFRCRCGSPRCHGLIAGFSALSAEERAPLQPLLACYLLEGTDEPTGAALSLSDPGADARNRLQ